MQNPASLMDPLTQTSGAAGGGAPMLVSLPQQQSEEDVICQVVNAGRRHRSKSCHERSNSLKRGKRKLAPDEDLITVVTDDHYDHHHFPPRRGEPGGGVPAGQGGPHVAPQPAPRASLGQMRNGSNSLGNILVLDQEHQVVGESDAYIVQEPQRQTLPRSQTHHHHSLYYESQQPPMPMPRTSHQQPLHPRSSGEAFYRHPLSQSTETILYHNTDQTPIVPNRSPGTPDIWLPMRPPVRA